MRRAGRCAARHFCCPICTLMLLLVTLTSCQHRATDSDRVRQVRIAAASDLQFALGELIEQFEREHPDTRLRASYGSSGKFFTQLTQQAPFDIYFSADITYPQRLIDRQLAEEDSQLRYAVGHLVLWGPPDSPIDLQEQGIAALLDPRVGRIAMANPRHAPYGRAALVALKNLDVYEQVQKRLVYGDNIAQAAQYVQSRAADVGILARSLAQSPAMQSGTRWELPPDSYPLIEQSCVIMNGAVERRVAKQFCDFVASARGRETLQRHGFTVPEE